MCEVPELGHESRVPALALGEGQHPNSYLDGEAKHLPGSGTVPSADGPQASTPHLKMNEDTGISQRSSHWAGLCAPWVGGDSELAPACRISYQGDRCSYHTHSLSINTSHVCPPSAKATEEVRRVIQGLERWITSHTEDIIHP